MLIGDSLAVGMSPYARVDGWNTIVRTGSRLSWVEAQNLGCVNDLVIMIGTNDLPGMSDVSALLYAKRINHYIARVRPIRAIWATPGCTSRSIFENGSIILDRNVRNLSLVHNGRIHRCNYPTNDGIHTTTRTYQSWWHDIISSFR